MRGCAVAVAVAATLLVGGQAKAGSAIQQVGLASWYKMGNRTASGESYDPKGITAAHPSLPFDTKVRVTNASSGESVVVRINDRGPFTGDRIIDLSQGAAQAIDLVKAGVAKVKIEVLGTAAAANETPTDEAPEASDPPVELASAELDDPREAQPLRLMAERRIGSSTR